MTRKRGLRSTLTPAEIKRAMARPIPETADDLAALIKPHAPAILAQLQRIATKGRSKKARKLAAEALLAHLPIGRAKH